MELRFCVGPSWAEGIRNIKTQVLHCESAPESHGLLLPERQTRSYAKPILQTHRI